MATQDRPRLYTAEDLMRMANGNKHLELVRGEIVEMSPTGGKHTILAVWIAHLFTNHVVENKIQGYVTGEVGGFILARKPDTVRAPDVGYISKARMKSSPPDGLFPVAPELAVEIASPDDKLEDILEKVQEYLAAGTRIVWLFFFKTRTVAVHTASGSFTLDETGILDGGDVLPGFSLSVREVFSVLDEFDDEDTEDETS
jgi:Uma2 family endonuclease